MSTDRRMRLWSLLVESARGDPVTVQHVCAAVIPAAGVDSAAVSVVLPSTAHETLVATDRGAADLEDLALTLGEGPGADAGAHGPVLVGDLATAEYAIRWPVFTPAAAGLGVRAVFALPLQVGGARLGVMSLYRAEPGNLGPAQLADALTLADTACALLLDAERPHRPHRPGLNGQRPEPAGPQYPEVHQATGMITVQLGVSATVALIRLRAHAFASNRRLRDVAGDVVARRLRFDPEVGERDPSATPDPTGSN
jgi:hypothetical protein